MEDTVEKAQAYYRGVALRTRITKQGTTEWFAHVVNCRRCPADREIHPTHGGSLNNLRRQIDDAMDGRKPSRKA